MRTRRSAGWFSGLAVTGDRQAARRRRLPRLNLELLEQRTLLAVDAAQIRHVSDQLASSSLIGDFLQPVLEQQGKTFSDVSAAVRTQVDNLLAKASAERIETSTEFTIGLAFKAEAELGPSAILARFGVEVAELTSGYNFAYSFTNNDWTLSRDFEIVLLGRSIAASYSATFDSVTDDTANQSVDFGLTVAIGRGLEVGPNVGQILQAGAEFSIGQDYSLQFKAEYSRNEFLATVQQATFAEALADVLIPYYNDSWWQNLITGAGQFIPVVGIDQLIDVSFPDTPLGILAHADAVQISATKGLDVQAEFWAGVGGSLDAAIGNISLGIRVGAALSAGLETTIFGPIEMTGWSPSGSELLSISKVNRRFEELEITPTGVTVITGGYQADGGGDAMAPLARAIHDRAGGWLLDYDLSADGASAGFDTATSGVAGSAVQSSILPMAVDRGRSGEVVLLFDWSAESNESSAGWGESAGDALFSTLVGLGLIDPVAGAGNVPLHFIGHGYGAAVTSEAVERLAQAGVPVDHVTYLDPHDFDQGRDADAEQGLADLGLPVGYGATVWEGTGFADVYYQTRGGGGVAEGRPIPGAFNRLLDTELPPSGANPIDDHNYVWQCFYLATVQGLIPPSSCNPPPVQVGYHQTGYAFSRVAGSTARPAPVLYTDQDHKHSEAAVKNAVAGAEQDFYTEMQWPPASDSFRIINGDFESNGATLFANIEPGWSHHAGGGNGAIANDGTGNYLELNSGAFCRSHNLLYVPPVIQDDFFVAFDLRRTNSSSDDVLQVRFDRGCHLADGSAIQSTVLGELSLAEADSGFLPRIVPIPQSLRGQAHSLVFEIKPGGASIDSAVRIDNVRFISLAGGGTGDVIRVDLPASGSVVQSLEFEKGDLRDFEVFHGIPLTMQFDPATGVTTVFDGAERLGRMIPATQVEGIAARHFYFLPETLEDPAAPIHDADTSLAGFQGVIVAKVQIDGVTSRIPILVHGGFSTSGRNSISSQPSTLTNLQVQQRLRHLGYPDSDGNPIGPDGAIGPLTRHAIGLFNAAVHAGSHRFSPSSTINVSWINDRNAPAWVELQAIPGLEIVGGDTQTERWATSWANDLIAAAAAEWQQNPIVPHPNLAMIGASLRAGGDTPFHVSHEAGMDLDFDTPSTNQLFDANGAIRAPFFAVVQRPGTSTYYVAAKAGGVLVQNAGGSYEAADPNSAGFDWSAALRAEDAWDNRAVLDKLRDPSLMASGPGYDLDVVRGQIEAFAAFRETPTPSGVTVQNILYNDPRTWDIGGGQFVRFHADHGGHLHVNVGTSLLSQAELQGAIATLRTLAIRTGEATASGSGATTVSLVGASVSDAAGANAALNKGLVSRAENYAAADPTPTAHELRQALEGTTVHSDGTASQPADVTIEVTAPAPPPNDAEGEEEETSVELLFPLVLRSQRTTRRVPLDLGTTVAQLGLTLDASATLSLTGTVDYAVTIGVDRTPGLSFADAYFLQVSELTVGMELHSTDLNLLASLGFVQLAVDDGVIDLEASLDIHFNDDQLTLNEFRAKPLSELVSLTPGNATLHASLPIIGGIGASAGQASCGNPLITIDDQDLFGGAAAEIAATGFDELLNFNNITPDAVLSLLGDFNDWLGQYRDSPIFDAAIPFTDGKTLGDTFDWQDALVKRLTGRLVTFYGTPAFETTGDFADRLARVLGLDAASINEEYDCSTHDLKYHINFDHSFDPLSVPVLIDVDAGQLAGFTTNSVVDVEAEVSIEFDLLLNLASRQPGDSARDFVAFQHVSMSGEVSLRTDDLDATAQLDSLTVHVADGTASFDGSFQVELKDPATGTPGGRLTLRELFDGLADISTIVTTPEIESSGTFSLPVSADPFNLGELTIALSGLVSGTEQELDFSLTAEVAGAIGSVLVIESLPNGAPSKVTLTKRDGLTIDARAKILGVPANLQGQFAVDGDFAFSAETDPFDIGNATVQATGSIHRTNGLIGWDLTGSVTDWSPVPFLTVERLDVAIDSTMIRFETTTDIAGIAAIHLQGDFQFADKSYAIVADAATDWEPLNGVHLTNVFFEITNRTADSNARIIARADLELFDTHFVVTANITADGQWLAAQPVSDFEPIPGLEIRDTLIVATTYELILDVGTIPAVEVTEPPAQLAPSQRLIPVGVNLVAAATLPQNIPAVGGSEVQIAGHIGTSLAELSIEAKLVLAGSPEIAGLFTFDSVGLRITGAPSLSVFGLGRVLHDQIPTLDQDIGVEAELKLDLLNTTLSGSLSLLQPLDGSPPISNLFGIEDLNILEGNGEFGINFATTPLPLPTIGFNLVAELPDFAAAALSLPHTIGAALSISTTEPIFAISALNWRPLQLLGIDDIVVDQLSVVAAPRGGSIGTKIFPIGFSAAFEADILNTHVSFLGLFNQQTQGIILNGSISTTRIAGITIGGPGCDGVIQDGLDNSTPANPDPDADNGACFTAALTVADPLDSGLTVDFTIDLPGPGGLLDVHGEFGHSFLVLDAAIENWRPISGVNFNGSLHAEAVLRTVNLVLDFDVTATILGAATHFEGTLSASPSGFAIFAAATVENPLLDLTATIDIGMNSPFSIGLAADFTLPGARPTTVQLAGVAGANGISLDALVDNWGLVPGVSFDGSIAIDASLQGTNLVVAVDVTTHLLGSPLNLEGTIAVGAGSGLDIDLKGDIHFGGKRLAMASVDLTAELHTHSAGPFELSFHGKLKLIDDLAAVDVTAEMSTTPGGGFAFSIDASVDFSPTLHLDPFTVKLEVTLDANIAFGVNPTFASASLDLHGRACASISGLGEKCTSDVGFSIGLSTGTYTITNVKPKIKTKKVCVPGVGCSQVPTGVTWKDITRDAADTSEPSTTVGAVCLSANRNTCGAIQVTGSSAPEAVRVARFLLGNRFNPQIDRIVVQAQNTLGEWVTLLTRNTSDVSSIDMDLEGGDDSIDLRGAFSHSVGSAIVAGSAFPGPAVLRGGSGSDIIRGGAGVNTIYGGADGSEGAGRRLVLPGVRSSADSGDELFGGPANDSIFGQDGNDIITSGGGSDSIEGGGGVNLIDGRLELRGTERAERIEVVRDHQTQQVCVPLPFGGTQCFTATIVDDLVVQSFTGESPAVTLGRFKTGAVTLLDVDASGGDDRIEIAAAVTIPAILHGGSGHDWISGGGGPDQLFGDDGIDLLVDAAGDLLNPGTGASVSLNAGQLSFTGTAEPDRLELSTDQGLVRVRAIDESNGETALYRLPTASITALHAVTGDGNDTLTVAATLFIPIQITLGFGNDFGQAGSGPATVHGGDGDDYLSGGPGNDLIFGEDGNDTVVCGGGNDELDGGTGINQVSCNGNRPPALEPISDHTVDEGTTLSFTVTASDPDRSADPDDESGTDDEPEFIQPIPYLSQSDSPFTDVDFLYFHLEDFEDGELSTPGVTAPAGTVFGPVASHPEGPVSWYRADGNVTDSVRGKNGLLKTGSGFVPGKFGQAFSFDGLDDEIEVPHVANAETTGAITIAAWVNPSSLGHGRPIAQRRLSSNTGGYTFETTHFPHGAENGLQFVLWIGEAVHTLQTPANVLQLGVWQHVAATYDQSVMRIYVNGVEQANHLVSGSIKPVNAPLVIGRNVVIPSFAWQGAIDELQIYDRGLSAAEIQAIFLTQHAVETVYENDFEGSVGTEWSDGTTDKTPDEKRRFLGQFGSDTVSLSLGDGSAILPDGLPVHEWVTISFDLFVIRTWDGNGTGCHGPDLWDLTVAGGPTLLHTSFNNPFPGCETTPQAYPESFSTGSHSFQTGADEVNTLGFTFPGVPGDGIIDSVYHLSFSFDHEDSFLRFDFSGILSTPGFDESWGLDNVTVSLGSSDRGGNRTYSVSGDFLQTTNPGGAWSYGWTSFRGSEFNLYPHHFLTGNGGDVWDEPAIVSLGAPSILYNGTGTVLTMLGRPLLPGQVSFHPGQNGEYGVVRWTAPAAGRANIAAQFRGFDTATTEVVILQNARDEEPNEIFSARIEGEGDEQSFVTLRDVQAGDTIDFAVGHGGNGFFFDSTLIDANITFTAVGDEPVGNDTPDSVDHDDGALDGSGARGHSFYHTSASESITFSFDAEVLGGLPTHVGLVWTDGGSPASRGGLEADITLEAFDAAGNSLGTSNASDLGDANRAGGTDEDRFFGLSYPGGIAMIKISDNDDGPIEIDHLQYGRIRRDPSPPPTQSLRFALDSSAPVGATIDPESGLFTWTPNESQGPGDHSIIVRVTDDGTPALRASRLFHVTVNEVNRPPILPIISDQTVTAGGRLAFIAQATDPDQPANRLDFSLDSGAPDGAAIHPATGEVTWSPSAGNHPPGDYEMTVRVTDRGSPPLSDTRTVTVTVLEDLTPPTIDRVKLHSNNRGITAIVLGASEPLDPARAADVNNYRLVTAGNDGVLGTSDDRSMLPASASVDSTGASLTLTAIPRLNLDELFKIIIVSPAGSGAGGIADRAGKLLDGDRDGVAGGDFAILAARATEKVSYRDRTGDSVSLSINRGVMDLLLAADGEAIHLSLQDSPGPSSVTGQVRTRTRTPGTTSIGLVTGTAGLQLLLPASSFDIATRSAAAVDELLVTGELTR